MWIKRNPNPCGKEAPDCVIRAICIALNLDWYETYWRLCELGAVECDMPSSNFVWGKFLYQLGFEPFSVPAACLKCITVRDFCREFPVGTYIIGTGSHAVAVINGNYYDSWDSGNEMPSYFWRIK